MQQLCQSSHRGRQDDAPIKVEAAVPVPGPGLKQKAIIKLNSKVVDKLELTMI